MTQMQKNKGRVLEWNEEFFKMKDWKRTNVASCCHLWSLCTHEFLVLFNALPVGSSQWKVILVGAKYT